MDFSKLKTANELKTYFEKVHNHSYYYHYTSLENINNILKKYQLWISDCIEFNDTLDKENFSYPDKLKSSNIIEEKSKEDYRKYYTICFSTGKNENLPMWYLYSGINGDGGRLRFTDSLINNAYRRGSFTLWKFHDKTPIERIAELKHGKNARFQFKDVLYYKEGISSQISLKYNTMTNYNVSKTEFEEFKSSYRDFLKGLIWYYEKETRFVIVRR